MSSTPASAGSTPIRSPTPAERQPQVGLHARIDEADLDLVPVQEALRRPFVGRPATGGRIRQPADELDRAAGLDPFREELGEVRAAGEKRVDVEADVEPVRVGRLERRPTVVGLGPVGPTRGRHVRDLDPRLGPSGHADRFAERGAEAGCVVAHVDREQRVPGRRGGGDRDQFVFVGRDEGHLGEPGRHAERPFVEGRQRRLLDGLAVGGGGGPRLDAESPDAEGSVPDERRHVDRWTGPFEGLEVPGEGRPVDRHCRIEVACRSLGADEVPVGSHRRRVADAAVAVDLGRDALRDLAARPAIAQEGEVGMAVDVDEAGRDDETGRVDDPSRLGIAKIADRGDPVAHDADIRSTPWRIEPIDDLPVADDEVVHRVG